MFIEYCVFSLKCCIFSELFHLCCSAGVLPAWCVYTHRHRGKTERDKSLEYFKIFKKHIILINTLYKKECIFIILIILIQPVQIKEVAVKKKKPELLFSKTLMSAYLLKFLYSVVFTFNLVLPAKGATRSGLEGAIIPLPLPLPFDFFSYFIKLFLINSCPIFLSRYVYESYGF